MRTFLPMTLCGSLMLLVLVATHAQAVNADDFSGVRTAKAVWDITVGNEKVFLDRMDLIKQTAENLRKRGIRPEFILVIHGEAAIFVTKSLKGTRFANQELIDLDKAQVALKDLQRDGSQVEVCSIAMQRARITHKNVQSFASIQNNVLENLIVLQNKGYAYMPVH